MLLLIKLIIPWTNSLAVVIDRAIQSELNGIIIGEMLTGLVGMIF